LVPAKTLSGAGKILTDLIPQRWKNLWRSLVEDVREFLWDERRAFLTLLAFTILLCVVLYSSGTFTKFVPYVYVAAARFQTLFDGPGDPEETYTQALGMRPSWGEAYYRRGLLRETRGRLEEALADFEMASTLSVSPARAYVAHGRVSALLDRMPQAVWDFQTAIEKDPSDEKAYVERAKFYVKTQKFQEALEDYQKALSLAPQSVDARIGVEEAKKGIEQADLKKKMTGE
jgi:tetratricopeptide (TPR) repeat protein